jgi:hypothetical protein
MLRPSHSFALNSYVAAAERRGRSLQHRHHTLPRLPTSPADRYPLSFYFVLVANVATYALVGLIVEIIRRHYKFRSLSN